MEIKIKDITKNHNILTPEGWVKNHGDFLYGFAVSRIYNKNNSLDLVQETFLSAWKNKHSFKGESGERTWLAAILKRKIIDYYRKKVSSKEEPLADSPFRENGVWEGHWKKERSPEQWTEESKEMETNEFNIIMNGCLSRLPSAMAAVFTLKVVEEYSSEEVCKELNISPSNLWTSIHRAKLQLRECLELKWFGKKNSYGK